MIAENSKRAPCLAMGFGTAFHFGGLRLKNPLTDEHGCALLSC
jgi:hypothetical protein